MKESATGVEMFLNPVMDKQVSAVTEMQHIRVKIINIEVCVWSQLTVLNGFLNF